VLLNAEFLESPWYGSRRMTRHLRRKDYTVGRGRIPRLMAKKPVYQRLGITGPDSTHRICSCLECGHRAHQSSVVRGYRLPAYAPTSTVSGFRMDRATPKVLMWLPDTMDVGFCIRVLNEARGGLVDMSVAGAWPSLGRSFGVDLAALASTGHA
jgi:putative transposase